MKGWKLNVALGALCVWAILLGLLAGCSAPVKLPEVMATKITTPSATPTPTPSETATEEAVQTEFKWGEDFGLTYNGVLILINVGQLKRSTNQFDRDNGEAKVTVCNFGDGVVKGLSASGLELYATDDDGGTYDVYGAYRSPEFPIYDSDAKALQVGKCRSGWVGFDGGAEASSVSLDVEDTTYSWHR